jgi:putative transposase
LSKEIALPYWRLFYHIVWATKGREPLIDAHAARVIKGTIAAVCEKEGFVLHAIGTMPDHVHVAVSIAPTKAISDIIARWKGGSSHLLNHAEQQDSELRVAWQAEYGIVSFSERNLRDVTAYVNEQPRRHAGEGQYWGLLEEAGAHSIPAIRRNQPGNTEVVSEGIRDEGSGQERSEGVRDEGSGRERSAGLKPPR